MIVNSVAAKALMDGETAIAVLSRRLTQWEGVCLLSICQEAAETSIETRGYYLEFALLLITRGYLLSEILRFDPVKEWRFLLLAKEVSMRLKR